MWKRDKFTKHGIDKCWLIVTTEMTPNSNEGEKEKNINPQVLREKK